MSEISLVPVAASAAAQRTDLIFGALLLAGGLVTTSVLVLILVFAVRYRDGSRASRRRLAGVISRDIEIGWTIATLFAFLFAFGWAAAQDLHLLSDTPGALTIQVVGKQWMWKAEHAGGQREIDALHVPADTAVRLVLNSQDVIHSFYVPALRLKHDAVPGRTQFVSFTASVPGAYPIECAEFCGTGHSRMLGTITVLSRAEYVRWLAAQPEGDTLAAAGARLFRELGCSGCHVRSAAVRAPDLAGLYGRSVPLADGRIVAADEAYLRDSILEPKRDVAAGYAPVMPSFAGRISESQLIELVAYIRSLSSQGTAEPGSR